MVFKTFQKPVSKGINVGKLLNFILIINVTIIAGIYIVALFPQMFRYKDQLLERSFVFIIGLIVLFLLRVLHYIFFKAKKKTETGTLELTSEKIILNQKEYPTSTIQNLRFVGNDILGEFRGFSSKGTENQIFITQNSGEEVSTNFLQTKENDLKSAKTLLEKYHELGILSEANLYNILNNTNYY